MATTKWVADPMHSELQFKVKHLMITTVTGYFRKFTGEVETEGDDFSMASKLIITAEAASIDTNNEPRDAHLRSPEFFDAEQFPEIRFTGRNFQASGDRFQLTGDLTIKSTTRPITLDVDFTGIVVDPYGQTKAGFTVTGKIRRKEFGLMWDAVTEAGHVVVSDEVRILCEIQMIKQA